MTTPPTHPEKKKKKKEKKKNENKNTNRASYLLMYISLLLWHMFKLCYVAGLWEEGTHVMEGPLN